jgi:hypothetical protein
VTAFSNPILLPDVTAQLQVLPLVCLQLPDLQCVYCPSGLHSQGRPSALFRRANVAFDFQEDDTDTNAWGCAQSRDRFISPQGCCTLA